METYKDFYGLALDRLSWAVGDDSAAEIVQVTLQAMGGSRLDSAEELRAFGLVLMRQGGGIAFLGALFVLHAGRAAV